MQIEKDNGTSSCLGCRLVFVSLHAEAAGSPESEKHETDKEQAMA